MLQRKPEKTGQGRDEPQVPEIEELDVALLVALPAGGEHPHISSQDPICEIDDAPGDADQDAKRAAINLEFQDGPPAQAAACHPATGIRITVRDEKNVNAEGEPD